MSAMLSLMYVQSLFQLGAKVGKKEGYYGEQTYLDMSFSHNKENLFNSQSNAWDMLRWGRNNQNVVARGL